MNQLLPSFTVRVYGIAINDRNEMLLSDEKYQDTFFTKLPGGGLEWGEGTRSCLQREMKEEFGQEIEVLEHIYTTDFFQESLFLKGYQVIAIYYRMKLLPPLVIRTSGKKWDFDHALERGQSLRWVPLSSLDDGELKFPLDQKVLRMIRGNM